MMKTYSSVKEALRSGIIIIADDKEGGSASTFRRRHTVDGPSHSQQTFPIISSTTIRLNPDNAPTETLDVSQYTQEDLKRLKEEDPFFYYSIPEIHLRSYRMESLEEEELADEESSVDEEGEFEESQDDESNNKGSEETRSIKQTQEQQQGNMKNINPSPQEKRPRSLSTVTHQQTTQGRRATLPPNFLQQSAAAAASAGHPALQMPIHQGPVTRSRRVSVEAHPYLILESMLSEDEEDDGDLYQFGLLNDISLNDVDEDSDEEEDVLLRILRAKGMLQERKGEEKEEE
mmetsp:Transcript_18981/g.32359  ORF Transcript_18981/g.32359 Transcript_18981/m.32359 type:complete len:289 (-) Transcript_18981:151-1017(-)